MFRNRLLGAALATGAVMLSLGGAPALAETRTGTPAAATKLTLSVSEDLGNAPARRVTLTCDPTGGNHPFAASACLQLAKADGNFTRLNVGLDPECTKEYAPITVRARGFWHGRAVAHRESFANRCLAQTRTDSVFRF